MATSKDYNKPDDIDDIYDPKTATDITWWEWGIMLAIIPFAVPVAITVVAGERIYRWWNETDS